MKARGWIPAGVNRIWDYAASLGGPIWKDHLWFFGSGSIADPQTRSYTNSVTRPTFTGNYYGKLNAQYKNTTGQVSYNWSGSETLGMPISNYTTATQNVTAPTKLFTAELQHVLGQPAPYRKVHLRQERVLAPRRRQGLEPRRRDL